MGMKRKSAEETSLLSIDSEKLERKFHQRCLPLEEGENLYDKYIQPLIAEFFAVLILVFIGIMASSKGNLLITASGFGLTWMVLSIIFSHISGAHVNPAVTLGVTLSGNMSGVRAILYILTQCVGGITGAAIAMGALDDSSYQLIAGGTTTLGTNITHLQGLFMETVLVVILVLVYLVTTIDLKSFLTPVALGLVLLVVIIAGGPITGGAVNPARALGAAVIFSKDSTDHWDDHWVYWVGPILGSLLAAVIFRFVMASLPKRTVCHDV